MCEDLQKSFKIETRGLEGSQRDTLKFCLDKLSVTVVDFFFNLGI